MYKATSESANKARDRPSSDLIDHDSPSFRDASTIFASVIQSFSRTSLLPLRQIIAVVSFLKHGKALRKLADPLGILFQTVLQKAGALPILPLLGIAGAYEGFSKYQEALDLSKIALSRAHDKAGVEANIAHSLLGRCYRELGDLDSSFHHLGLALDCKETRWSVYTRETLCNRYYKSGKYAESVDFFQDLVAKDRKRYGRNDLRTFASEHFVACALSDDERLEDAIAAWEDIAARRNISAWDRVWFQSDRLERKLLLELGWLCDFPLSEELLRRLHKIIESLRMDTKLLDLKARQRIGEAKFALQSNEEARSWFVDVAERLEKAKAKDKEYIEILSCNKLWLGRIVLALDGPERAIPILHGALDGFKSADELKSVNGAETLEQLVIAHRDLGHYGLMLELAKELVSIDKALYSHYDRFTRRSRRYVKIALAKTANTELPGTDSEETDYEEIDDEETYDETDDETDYVVIVAVTDPEETDPEETIDGEADREE